MTTKKNGGDVQKTIDNLKKIANIYYTKGNPNQNPNENELQSVIIDPGLFPLSIHGSSNKGFQSKHIVLSDSFGTEDVKSENRLLYLMMYRYMYGMHCNTDMGKQNNENPDTYFRRYFDLSPLITNDGFNNGFHVPSSNPSLNYPQVDFTNMLKTQLFSESSDDSWFIDPNKKSGVKGDRDILLHLTGKNLVIQLPLIKDNIDADNKSIKTLEKAVKTYDTEFKKIKESWTTKKQNFQHKVLEDKDYWYHINNLMDVSNKTNELGNMIIEKCNDQNGFQFDEYISTKIDALTSIHKLIEEIENNAIKDVTEDKYSLYTNELDALNYEVNNAQIKAATVNANTNSTNISWTKAKLNLDNVSAEQSLLELKIDLIEKEKKLIEYIDEVEPFITEFSKFDMTGFENLIKEIYEKVNGLPIIKDDNTSTESSYTIRDEHLLDLKRTISLKYFKYFNISKYIEKEYKKLCYIREELKKLDDLLEQSIKENKKYDDIAGISNIRILDDAKGKVDNVIKSIITQKNKLSEINDIPEFREDNKKITDINEEINNLNRVINIINTSENTNYLIYKYNSAKKYWTIKKEKEYRKKAFKIFLKTDLKNITADNFVSVSKEEYIDILTNIYGQSVDLVKEVSYEYTLKSGKKSHVHKSVYNYYKNNYYRWIEFNNKKSSYLFITTIDELINGNETNLSLLNDLEQTVYTYVPLNSNLPLPSQSSLIFTKTVKIPGLKDPSIPLFTEFLETKFLELFEMKPETTDPNVNKDEYFKTDIIIDKNSINLNSIKTELPNLLKVFNNVKSFSDNLQNKDEELSEKNHKLNEIVTTILPKVNLFFKKIDDIYIQQHKKQKQIHDHKKNAEEKKHINKAQFKLNSSEKKRVVHPINSQKFNKEIQYWFEFKETAITLSKILNTLKKAIENCKITTAIFYETGTLNTNENILAKLNNLSIQKRYIDKSTQPFSTIYHEITQDFINTLTAEIKKELGSDTDEEDIGKRKYTLPYVNNITDLDLDSYTAWCSNRVKSLQPQYIYFTHSKMTKFIKLFILRGDGNYALIQINESKKEIKSYESFSLDNLLQTQIMSLNDKNKGVWRISHIIYDVNYRQVDKVINGQTLSLSSQYDYLLDKNEDGSQSSTNFNISDYLAIQSVISQQKTNNIFIKTIMENNNYILKCNYNSLILYPLLNNNVIKEYLTNDIYHRKPQIANLSEKDDTMKQKLITKINDILQNTFEVTNGLTDNTLAISNTQYEFEQNPYDSPFNIKLWSLFEIKTNVLDLYKKISNNNNFSLTFIYICYHTLMRLKFAKDLLTHVNENNFSSKSKSVQLVDDNPIKNIIIRGNKTNNVSGIIKIEPDGHNTEYYDGTYGHLLGGTQEILHWVYNPHGYYQEELFRQFHGTEQQMKSELFNMNSYQFYEWATLQRILDVVVKNMVDTPSEKCKIANFTPVSMVSSSTLCITSDFVVNGMWNKKSQDKSGNIPLYQISTIPWLKLDNKLTDNEWSINSHIPYLQNYMQSYNEPLILDKGNGNTPSQIVAFKKHNDELTNLYDKFNNKFNVAEITQEHRNELNLSLKNFKKNIEQIEKEINKKQQNTLTLSSYEGEINNFIQKWEDLYNKIDKLSSISIEQKLKNDKKLFTETHLDPLKKSLKIYNENKNKISQNKIQYEAIYNIVEIKKVYDKIDKQLKNKDDDKMRDIQFNETKNELNEFIKKIYDKIKEKNKLDFTISTFYTEFAKNVKDINVIWKTIKIIELKTKSIPLQLKPSKPSKPPKPHSHGGSASKVTGTYQPYIEQLEKDIKAALKKHEQEEIARKQREDDEEKHRQKLQNDAGMFIRPMIKGKKGKLKDKLQGLYQSKDKNHQSNLEKDRDEANRDESTGMSVQDMMITGGVGVGAIIFSTLAATIM
jgi:hypothetical protein